jgi:DNA-binding MarR family transcriptional regulator
VSTDQAQRPRAEAPGVDPRWADLADAALVIAREIQLRGYTDKRAQSLSTPEGMVMRYLHHDGDATPSRIATATGVQRTNLSAVLRSLEQKGLLERRASPTDGRGVSVRLTEDGVQHYNLVRSEWAAGVAAAAGYDARHLDQTLTVLTAVRDGLVRDRPQVRCALLGCLRSAAARPPNPAGKVTDG